MPQPAHPAVPPWQALDGSRPSAGLSLVETVAGEVVAKHEELRQALAKPPSDTHIVSRLIREIWSLAREFQCAVWAEQIVAQARAGSLQSMAVIAMPKRPS